MMKYPVGSFFFCIIFLGCTPSVNRHGYEAKSTAGAQTCPVVIQRATQYSAADVDVLGNVDVGDTGFSTQCNQGDVLAVMRKEACSVRAQIVDITEERRPDVTSTCYRAKARLLRLKRAPNEGELVDSPAYRADRVARKSNEDDSSQALIIGIAVAAGLAAGVTVAIAGAR